jgi:hypothetical protein
VIAAIANCLGRGELNLTRRAAAETTLTRRQVLACVLAAPLLATPFGTYAATPGSFQGSVTAEWLNDGRRMRLTKPFGYIGPDGRNWPVPAGTVVDGASIPSSLWSVIGVPFEGLYRDPSVIHDYYCDTRTRKYEDVHQVFYDAMLTAGVGHSKAWLMYEGVSRFGPRWPDPKIDKRCEAVDENYDFEKCARNAVKPELEMPKVDRDDFQKFINDVEGQADPADVAKLKQSLQLIP